LRARTVRREDAVAQQDWRESFGGHLTVLRHARRLTQEQLADRSGLSVRAISSLECGTRHPRRLTVERLATGLGLSAAERRKLFDAAAAVQRPGTGAPDAPPATVLPLAGRERELAELGAHVRGQGPPLIFYAAEPGMGKSRLLAEAGRLAAAAGVPVLRGGCRRGDDGYAPLVDALSRRARLLPRAALLAVLRAEPGLAALLPEFAGLLPDGPPRPAVEHHRRLVFDAALRLLDDAARTSGRVVLLLDDLQWAQPGAADLLAHLVHRMGPRLRAVATARAGELPPHSRLAQCVADLARLGLVGHRVLAPLSTADAERLVAYAAGGERLRPSVRREVLRRSGGLPLFLAELGAAAGELPDHVRVAVRQQLADLPADTRVLLQRIAVGPAVTGVERLVGRDDTPERVLAALEPAIRRRILDDEPPGLGFRYPLFREVLAAELGPTRRRLLRSAAAALVMARHLRGVRAA
jgi:transcriptional regulator with XRE-family HTH domain